MEKKCVLTFQTSKNTRRSMTIRDPKENLDENTVRVAFSAISASDIIYSEFHGTLDTLERAEIVAESKRAVV